MNPVSVLFLGTGDAFSAGGRLQAGCLLRSEDTCLLLDCGATTLAALHQAGIRADKIDTIVVTHLHGDHFAGLPFLFVDAVYSEPRTKPLCIAGPPGIEKRVHTLFQATYPGAAAEPLPFRIAYNELLPGHTRHFGACVVDAFRVPHQEQEVSLGVRITLGGRRILYTGDSGWTEDLVGWSEGSDLFICECSYFGTRRDSHLDYPRIAENRRRFGTRRLILTHLGKEVLEHHDQLEVEIAHDGMLVELP